MNGGGISEKELGKRLQKARQAAGLTQQQLCQKASLSISTLAKIERGAIKSPSVFTVASIASACGIPLEQIIDAPNTKPAALSNKKASKSGVKFIYFDVNGVLVRFFHRAFIKLAEETGAAADQIETTFWHYNDQICRGEMPLGEFNKILSEQLGKEGIDWQNYYFSGIEPIHAMHRVVKWAEEHYHIGLLTNIMPGFLDQLLDDKAVPSANYSAIIDSSKVGAVKPEPKIYQAALEASGVKPSEILLIDDGRTNLMAAEHAGWKVLWFDDYRPEESAERVRDSLNFD